MSGSFVVMSDFSLYVIGGDYTPIIIMKLKIGLVIIPCYPVKTHNCPLEGCWPWKNFMFPIINTFFFRFSHCWAKLWCLLWWITSTTHWCNTLLAKSSPVSYLRHRLLSLLDTAGCFDKVRSLIRGKMDCFNERLQVYNFCSWCEDKQKIINKQIVQVSSRVPIHVTIAAVAKTKSKYAINIWMMIFPGWKRIW